MPLALLGDAEAHGAMIAFETPVLAGRAGQNGLVIETGGRTPMRIAAARVVNAAGSARRRSRAQSPACRPPGYRHYISPRATTFP